MIAYTIQKLLGNQWTEVDSRNVYVNRQDIINFRCNDSYRIAFQGKSYTVYSRQPTHITLKL